MLKLVLDQINRTHLPTRNSLNGVLLFSDRLYPIRRGLNRIEIHDRAVAHLICRLIPMQCPFEREIRLFGYTLLQIPPLCKLNPLYEEVVSLRWRALCYLADECGEDVRCYC
ncbi:Mo-dependent nitrogenase C-terminal domain-containing protein [Pantanalinema sp. GBBB05]|uniref:Mo-dependent nitrogenase C-terminal domain-containing protein n=1 Tax=Pantanalinema sp. GBBB05 TaxID=2604139 RepID=UPI001D754983|nr:nitrogenase [Pantanalinema sp. GBBB05]